MWASGNQLDREAEKEAKDAAEGRRKFINLAAKKRKDTQRKLAPKVQ